jgi:hypothetical protein
MTDWKPISTVPKDGSAILLLIDGNAIEGQWEGHFFSVVSLPSHGCGCCSDNNPLPTGWHPLPVKATP